jgi:hypothetical protein
MLVCIAIIRITAAFVHLPFSSSLLSSVSVIIIVAVIIVTIMYLKNFDLIKYLNFITLECLSDNFMCLKSASSLDLTVLSTTF